MIKDGLNLENKDVIHSFLMIGQSNMAGRGKLGSVPPIDNKQCFMLRMGRWQTMREPINPDRSVYDGTFRSGVSLGTSFADKAANTMGWRVGMIPCADGGTKIEQWMPGEILYDHAVFMAKLAMRTSVLSGILWHQGESDCIEESDLLAHPDRFFEMATQMRRDLGAENLPFLIGEISDRIEVHDIGARAKQMNDAYRAVAAKMPLCRVVSAEDLAVSSDKLHFDAPSLRVFGERYFDVYKQMIEK